MTPVILLSDGYLGNGSEPWRIPDVADLVPFTVRQLAEGSERRATRRRLPPLPARCRLGARSWVPAGTPGLEHRIGGLEKDAETAASATIPTTTSA